MEQVTNTRLTCRHKTTGKKTYREEFQSRNELAAAISRVPRIWSYEVEYQDAKGRWHNVAIS